MQTKQIYHCQSAVFLVKTNYSKTLFSRSPPFLLQNLFKILQALHACQVWCQCVSMGMVWCGCVGVRMLELAKPCPSPHAASKASLLAPFLTNHRHFVLQIVFGSNLISH